MTDQPDIVERLAPFEKMLADAYLRGWNEGCETMVEDHPALAPILQTPHKDAMNEGCGTFLGEIWPGLRAALSTIESDVVDALKVSTHLLKRYLKETPLGHQPHMIAYSAEAAVNVANRLLAALNREID